MPEPNSMMLLGSGTVPAPLPEPLPLPEPPLLPYTVNASEGTDPTVFSEAEDGPEFSSQ